MEILYLLGSILSTCFTSFILSLLLPFRWLLRRHGGAGEERSLSQSQSVTLYEGTVWHERRRPVHHSFRYDVRYALVDLDSSPYSSATSHLSGDEARRFASTSGPVYLLTIPSSVGYEQNPLSLYYCYETDDGSAKYLRKCIAEVTNTPWGESVLFVFNPNSDLVAKPLHVSPFMDMLGTWNIRASDPGDNLYVAISVQHPELGDYFSATLKVKRVSSFESDHTSFFYLMPHKVAIWIYWHAFKLWWKNVQFLQHPRYINPSYRKDATSRDQKLQCRKGIGSNENKHQQFERLDEVYPGDRRHEAREFIWRNAKWPWA